MKRIYQFAMISGILCVIFYLMHDVIGAMNYPGYHPMKQAVSDLTATDAPSFAIASGLSSVYGIFSCLCCALLCVMAMGQRKELKLGIYLFALMSFVSAIGYSIFPLSSAGYDGSVQSMIHVFIITALVVLLSIASLIAMAIGGFRDGKRILGIVSVFALVCMLLGAAGSTVLPQDVFGLAERFSTYSAVVFTGFLGIYWYIAMMKMDSGEAVMIAT